MAADALALSNYSNASQLTDNPQAARDFDSRSADNTRRDPALLSALFVFQATAMDNDILISYGGAIKTLHQKGDIVTVGDYGILWGSTEQADLVGDYFTKETFLGARKGLGVDTMLHHGLPLSADLAKYSSELLPPTVKAEPDDTGLFVATLLDLRNAYDRKVFGGIEEGLLSWSSGANPRGVRRAGNAKSGEITQWPVMEFSFTPTPCEPRMAGIMTLKALPDFLHEPGSETQATYTKAVRVLTDLKPREEVKSEATADGTQAIFGDIGTSLGVDALSSLSDRLRYQVFYEVFAPASQPSPYPASMLLTSNTAPTKEQRLEFLERGLSEFQQIALRIAGAILEGAGEQSAADAAKALQPNPLEILEAGQREGSRFVDHSSRLLVANEEFLERVQDLVSARSQSHKAGRVLSATNYSRLSEWHTSLQGMLAEVGGLLEAHKPPAPADGDGAGPDGFNLDPAASKAVPVREVLSLRTQSLLLAGPTSS